MTLSLLDQAQPILIIALVAGLVIGIAVFVLASRRHAPHAAATGNARAERDFPNTQSPAPAARRTLPTDTRQRATNLIDDIARFYQNRHTG